jgi:hypothetical protein
MHHHLNRHLNCFGLSLLLTLGVVAWSQQQTHSFSQLPSSQAPLILDLLQKAQAVQE